MSWTIAPPTRLKRPWPVRAACFSLAILVALGGGCSRKYWREQADDLTYDIIKKKEVDPRWTLPRVDVMADPRSRFYDPFDPDFTPLPPDDPAAHDYMHWVYGMNGYKKWHEFGDLPAAENPDWLEPFGMSSEVVAANYSKPGNLPVIDELTLEEAVELSWIHSRDFQTQVENVYLVALTLTFQRFQFDLQYVGLTGRPSSQVNLEDVPSSTDSINWGNRVGVSQLLPSGAQLAAELANNTLWLFSGGNASDSTASTISYSIVQPLLANGGRRFVLEGLTQAERNMLYAVRDLARFRMGFFTSTVAGGNSAGISAGVTQAAQPALAATPTAVAQGGYLGLLQQLQIISNQRYIIRQFKERLERLHATANQAPTEISWELESMPEIGPVDPDDPKKGPLLLKIPPEFENRLRYKTETKRLYLKGQLTDLEEEQLLELSNDPAYRIAVSSLADLSVMDVETTNQQIAQLQTQLAQNCNQLRTSVVNLQDSIDRYKLFLGLPPDMPITIDDGLLKPFELIDARLIRLQDRLNTFVPEPPIISPSHPDIETIERVNSLFSQLSSQNLSADVLRGLIEEMNRLEQDIRRDAIATLEEDFRRYEERRRERPLHPPDDNCLQIYRDDEADQRLKETLLTDFYGTSERLMRIKSDLKSISTDLEKEPKNADKLKKTLEELSDLREDFMKTTQSLSVVQINLRVDLIELNRFELPLQDALQVALENRMDLMNARASVMDARRNVEVAANQLQALLNIVAAGDVRTQSLGLGNLNPLDFRGGSSSFRAGVQFTTPVQLVQQRNVYRAALISYQRARRNYMRTEDQVKLDVRVTWRQLSVLKQNLETARENVRAAAAQLDIAIEQSTAPVTPGLGAGGAAGAGGTAAGLNTINALQAVLNAQNQLIQIWVSFETNRLAMYNFMGTMEIDEYGFWVDDFYQRRAEAARGGRNPNEILPDSPPSLPSVSPPQELINETPTDDPAPLPQPQAHRSGARRNEKLQLVKAESWPDRPERPAAPAARGSRETAPGAVDPGRTGSGGGGVLELSPPVTESRADGFDHGGCETCAPGAEHHGKGKPGKRRKPGADVPGRRGSRNGNSENRR
ncbi:MAG: TolC family protein [Planctomycetales bacterium]